MVCHCLEEEPQAVHFSWSRDWQASGIGLMTEIPTGSRVSICSRGQTCARIRTTFFFHSRSWPKKGWYVIYFWCSLCLLYPPFTSDSILFFTRPKFREKCPRSCISCRILEPRSESVLAYFYGVHNIFKEIPRHITYYSMEMDSQAQYSEVP